jgi:transposase
LNKRLWVGLDLGALSSSICVINSVGEVVHESDVATSVETIDATLRPLRRGNIQTIAMESGSGSFHLARGLQRLKYRVAVLDARQVATYLGIAQNKTDTNDARGIAEIARSGRSAVSEVFVKAVEFQKIRSLLATRQQIVRMRVASEAAIAANLRLYGGKTPRVSSNAKLRSTVMKEILEVRKQQKVDLRVELEPVISICESLRSYADHLDKVVAQTAADIEICRRFMDIPGVGPITALSFYSAICDPIRFEKSVDVGPYLGMVPRVRQSGETVARYRISKMGNAMTRQHLNQAAMILLRPSTKETRLKSWGLQVRERRGAGRAKIAVARKLSTIMLAMWKRGTVFDPTKGWEDHVAKSLPLSQSFPSGEGRPENRVLF